MEPIQIRTFDKTLDIRVSGRRVLIPPKLQAKIDAYWQQLQTKNPALHNGEVFTVRSVKEDEEMIHIRLDETNYAHHLYDREIGNMGRYAVQIIHPAALIVSSDQQMIFGSMGAHTSLSGVIQCCGGGIDRGAVAPNGGVNITATMISELAEELGITANDERIESMTHTYLKFGGPTGKMTLAYIVRLNITGNVFMRDYAGFVESLKTKGEEPEFSKLFCINGDMKAVDGFIKQYKRTLSEYMPILLQTVAEDLAK